MFENKDIYSDKNNFFEDDYRREDPFYNHNTCCETKSIATSNLSSIGRRIYSATGKLIKKSTIGDKILIQTKYGLRYLSGLDYTKRGTRHAVAKIIANEAYLRGYKGYYGVEIMDEEDVGAYTNNANTIWVNAKQLSNGTYDSYYDLASMLDHEANLDFGHKGEKNRDNYNFVSHANVYLGQSQTSDFGNTGKNNKYNVASSYVNRVYNAYLKDEITFEGVKSKYNDFNQLNKKNDIKIKSGFDGSGVSVEIKGESYRVDLKKLNSPYE